MLKIQFNSGETLTFDLTDSSSNRAWANFQLGSGWLEFVTAISILSNKVNHTLPIPNSGIRIKRIGASLVRKKRNVKGVRAWYEFDNYRMTLTVYNGDANVTRVDIRKEGANVCKY